MADAKLGRAVVEIVVDGDKLTAALAKSEKQTRASVDRIASTLSSVGTKMTVGISAPLMGLATVAVKAASDTAESLNKMNVVFGQSATGIKTWAQDSARSLGMSRQAAYEATATLGNLFTTMGLGQQPAADMSMRLVQLAADLASFNNIDPAEALEKLRSGLVGEAEPLRSLGIQLDQASVKAEAMRMGLLRAGGELSTAAALQARYSLILQQTATAQGDFARTADGLANSTRIAKAELADAAAKLGEKLLPAASDAIGVVNDLADAFNGLDDETQGLLIRLGLVAIVAGPAVKTLGELLSVATRLGPILAAILASPAFPVLLAAAGLTSVTMGVAQLADKVQPAAPGVAALTDPTKHLRELQAQAARQRDYLQAHPEDIGALAGWANLQKQIAQEEAALKQLGSTGTHELHNIEQAAVRAGVAVAAIGGGGSPIKPGMEGAERLGDLYKSRGWLADLAHQNVEERYQTAWDEWQKSWNDSLKAGETAQTAAANRVVEKFRSLAVAVTTALDGAREKAKGLFDATKGPGGGSIEPGANSWAEPFYRMADVAAAKERGKGKDTEKWMSMYYPGMGLDAASAAAKADLANFESGNLLAPGVFEKIDWQAAAKQAMASQEGQKQTQYAGEAAAALMAAGKEITPENMKAMVNQLAQADKDQIVPSLQDIQAAVTVLDDNANTSLENLLTAVENLPGGIAAALTAEPPPTKPPAPPPNGTTVPPGGVPKYASGTPFHPGGPAIIGDVPELVELPRGSRVTPLAGAGGLGLAQLAGAVQANLAGQDEDLGRLAGELAAQLGSLATQRVMRLMLESVGS